MKKKVPGKAKNNNLFFIFFLKFVGQWVLHIEYQNNLIVRLLINYKESNLCYSSRMAARKSNNHVTDVITATRGVEYRVRLTT